MMDGSNPGLNLSQDCSSYLSPISPDNNVTNEQLNYPLTFPWSCESGGCNCSDIDTMSDKTAAHSSTPDSFTSVEATSYEANSYPSPTNTEGIIAQQIKEGICPLATGATNECKPELCGVNAPCMAFWSVPEIEECGEVPCLVKPEEHSSSSSRTTSPPRRQTLEPAAKRPRREAGLITSKLRDSTSSGPISTIERDRSSSSPKRHKKSNQPASVVDTKQAHSLVEKRYRENLNAKINELNVVLSCSANGSPSPDSSPAKKSEVLQAAIDYVNQSQLEMRHMTNDINRLNAKLKAIEKQTRCEDCNIVKNFNGLRVFPSSTMNGIGASYNMAATSAG